MSVKTLVDVFSKQWDDSEEKSTAVPGLDLPFDNGNLSPSSTGHTSLWQKAAVHALYSIPKQVLGPFWDPIQEVLPLLKSEDASLD